MTRQSTGQKSSPEKTSYQAQLLKSRLAKRLRHLRKWARRNDVACYRLYDKDIPEIPLAIDIFTLDFEGPAATGDGSGEQQTYLRVYLYQRPYQRDEAEEEAWLAAMIEGACQVVGIHPDNAVAKTRMRQRGAAQYERQDARDAVTGIVREQGHRFFVNLSSYLDTGLFMDHRPLRKIVGSEARGKSVLNLFCYTATFSVYAAAGGAETVDSVDLSNTYLDWGRRNFALNGLDAPDRYRFIRRDVARFLTETREGWDMIVLDPPTFSNSKMTRDILDINRDWHKLVNACLRRLNPNGTLYFSINSRRLRFDEALLSPPDPRNCQLVAKDISAATIPEDFRNKKIHRCWRITI